ncbi:MAG: tetratricopeptide repeat protein, partial [Planctomycetaceae bacterium]|nr:tetratricopeptide repeat protein [Planctomycetaceae bacterium]
MEEVIDGYYTISLHCVTSPGNAQVNYRFAMSIPNALERDMLDDSADGSWQHWDIISAALVADGINNRQEIDAYREKVAKIVRQIPPQTLSQPKDQLAQTIFEILHHRLLTGTYNVGTTNLVQAIDSGNFNCVSATVLFHALAQQAGLDVCGLEMRGHALSRVRMEGQAIDIETTCANWFKLSDSERTFPRAALSDGSDTFRFSVSRQTPPILESLPKVNRSHITGNSETANTPANYPPTLPQNKNIDHYREISDVQLIATIYYNHGVDELTAGHYSSATVANIKALKLDPHNENAWRNLMATLNNWAIASASQGDYLNAAQLLDEGRLIDDCYELFRANQVHTYYHWTVEAADLRDYDKALTLLRLAENRLPNQPNLRFLHYTIRRKMAQEYFTSQEDRKAFAQYDVASAIAPDGVNV